MRTINIARKCILDTEKLQRVDANQKYFLTNFCIQRKCEEGILLFHTIMGELVLLDKEEFSEITEGCFMIYDWRKTLASHWFLVPEEYNGKSHVLELRNNFRLNDKTSITSYTILPTTLCNARCFYCYEKDMHLSTMTRETAEKTVDYIVRH